MPTPTDKLAAWFGNVQIGSHAWLNITRSRNILVEMLPRLESVVIKDLGGSTAKTLVVNAWALLNTRQEVEQYLDELDIDLRQASAATLTVSGRSYTFCHYYNIAPSSDDQRWNYFTVTFFRSS